MNAQILQLDCRLKMRNIDLVLFKGDIVFFFKTPCRQCKIESVVDGQNRCNLHFGRQLCQEGRIVHITPLTSAWTQKMSGSAG